MASNHASHNLLPINPPKHVWKPRPVNALGTSARYCGTNGEKAREAPALRLVVRLWIELWSGAGQMRLGRYSGYSSEIWNVRNLILE